MPQSQLNQLPSRAGRTETLWPFAEGLQRGARRWFAREGPCGLLATRDRSAERAAGTPGGDLAVRALGGHGSRLPPHSEVVDL